METINDVIHRSDMSQEEKADVLIDWVLNHVKGMGELHEHPCYPDRWLIDSEILPIVATELKQSVRA